MFFWGLKVGVRVLVVSGHSAFRAFAGLGSLGFFWGGVLLGF